MGAHLDARAFHPRRSGRARVIAAVRGGDLRRRQAARTSIAALTTREREVLALLAAGLSNGQIGARLHLVEGTVKIHVGAILRKLDLDNRVKAAVLAQRRRPDLSGPVRVSRSSARTASTAARWSRRLGRPAGC